MNRYLVCSDIHRSLENFKYALKEASMDSLDGIIIAGDTELDASIFYDLAREAGAELYIVKGNCDYQNVSGISDMITFKLADGKTCMLTHGHRYQVKSDLDMLNIVADNLKADVVIYGHTHMYDDHRHGSRRIINPGALCGGFYDRPSYVLMTLYDGKIDVLKRTIL